MNSRLPLPSLRLLAAAVRRGDPRFERLLRDNLPEGAKPFDVFGQ